ncbi:hypothetical protein TSACC_3357 [Terrimicrobium sacchariphilum]|uniref:Uncharacterized protein n=1 Tax=Terrimicrobium sacchariphilum TaxID=690879 RepID=A0A146GDR2_TERSA|nr:hypothetical protein [Terrimicrobium sacchariphilum]GAT35292.1 hypothetical protein TSACC_3357 [Terrimicrobium sacchariphilum]
MTTRQRLDIAVRSVTGEDIRFAGNWDPLPGLSGNEHAIADRLNLDASRLRRCRDIYEILELMEINPSELPKANDAPSLF